MQQEMVASEYIEAQNSIEQILNMTKSVRTIYYKYQIMQIWNQPTIVKSRLNTKQ